jgi:hypothetical protein
MAKASDLAEKIAAVASKAWVDSQVMTTDEAVLYLQDALDVCRQLALRLADGYARRDERLEAERQERERHRVDV